MKRIVMVTIVLSLVAALSGCTLFKEEPTEENQKRQKEASVEGALDYLEYMFEETDFELTFVESRHKEAGTEQVDEIDGWGFYKKFPARTQTVYRGYSKKNTLYFFVCHNTYTQKYTTTYYEELKYINEFKERIELAKKTWGDKFIKTNVHIYRGKNYPLYNKSQFMPVYTSPEQDVRAVYNRLIQDIEKPFSTELMNTYQGYFQLQASPCLNIYVDYSLEELEMYREILIEHFNSTDRTLVIGTNGIFNRPKLTLEMFEELK
ncbi:hypothetical protein LJC51_10870 [Lachnospiraceae bacterium OttesenSCG-928-J05]|nr:hypothetical protein [Lachnospiraceae bacterium OttesenSCG-928-J05]